MARIRTIKPEFPHSESMGRISRDARLLFILLWTLCDDSGITRGSSRILASLLYPYDNDAKKLIDKWIAELEAENSVVRYVVEGHTYLKVLNWSSHQRIDKPTPSKLPPFDESSRITRESSRGVANCSDGIGSGPSEGLEGKGPIVIPGFVNAEAFRMWTEYRQAEKKPIKPHSYPALFKKFQKLGNPAAQLSAVEHSIANVYQGLFPERANTRNGHAAPSDVAAWAEAESLAKEVGFRDPYPAETASSYAAAVKRARDAPPTVPIAERRGLAGLKRVHP